jgi:hypothetical protein
MILATVVALFDAWTIFRGLDRPIIILGMIFGALTAAYLIINWAGGRIWRAIPLKEVIIGFLFAAGTLVFFVPQPGTASLAFVIAAFLFACLCSLNCMSIAVWERDLDAAQGRHSISTRGLAGPAVGGVIVMLAGLSLVFSALRPNIWPLGCCLFVSAALLAGLHYLPIRRDERVALADLVLLAPFLFLLSARIT